MPNRVLTDEELKRANALLDVIRGRLRELSQGDPELLFAFRRKVYKELTYDERSKPMDRRRLKATKWKEQDGLCASCGMALPVKYNVLDRRVASAGYTMENTTLICQTCDTRIQASRGYA